MAQDPALTPLPLDTVSADAGKADKLPPGIPLTSDDQPDAEVDKSYWIACMADAERAERDWRERGREIVQIYRNETRNSRTGKLSAGPVTFNILYANTEVMLSAVYQKPPQPVVRSRFTSAAPMMPPPMPPTMPPSPVGVPPVDGLNMGAPPAAPPGGPVVAAGPAPMPNGGSPTPPQAMPPGPSVEPPGSPMGPPDGAPIIMAPQPGPPVPPAPMPPMPPMPPPEPPGKPAQKDIETAAAVMEKALEIVVEDDNSDAAIKMALKDTLLPGRGVCRVRWRPQLATLPVADPVMGGQLMHPETGEPQTEEKKVWEQVNDEYVYWEDLLVDPVRHAADMNWIAFRHLFTEQELETEFAGSEEYERLKAENKLSEILKWTDESAAKDTIGGGSAMKSASHLGDHVKKAMVWEIWDRVQHRIIWFIREASGLVLRVDPDVLQLQGFYPIPVPMLAVTTTDSRIPRPYYDLYAKLASDLDETSARISRLTKQIKVRGAYNSASRDIADILTANDNVMIPVDGVDMIGGGLSNHIWMVPVVEFMNALDKLFIAREQLKQAIYEIMGISDIMRGATKASETATAQRIKGSMGMGRLADAKSSAEGFVRDLLKLKAEIIATNFDAETLEAMTGEMVTPEVMAILRSDFTRTCTIDIESDSTVAVDEQAEQQAMTMVMQSTQAVMQGAVSMLQTGFAPPPQIFMLTLEFLKMLLHPIRFSRGASQMINDMQEQLRQQIMMQAMMPPTPPAQPGALPPAGGPPGPDLPPGGPPPQLNGGPPGMPM